MKSLLSSTLMLSIYITASAVVAAEPSQSNDGFTEKFIEQMKPIPRGEDSLHERKPRVSPFQLFDDLRIRNATVHRPPYGGPNIVLNEVESFKNTSELIKVKL